VADDAPPRRYVMSHGCGECETCTHCFADPDPDECPNCGKQTLNRDCPLCMDAYREMMREIDRTAFGYDPGDPGVMKSGSALRSARRAGLRVVTLIVKTPSFDSLLDDYVSALEEA